MGDAITPTTWPLPRYFFRMLKAPTMSLWKVLLQKRHLKFRLVGFVRLLQRGHSCEVYASLISVTFIPANSALYVNRCLTFPEDI